MTSQKKYSGFKVGAEIQGFRVQGSGIKYKGSGFRAEVQGVHDYRCLFPFFPEP
jgi:hypothetical protein